MGVGYGYRGGSEGRVAHLGGRIGRYDTVVPGPRAAQLSGMNQIDAGGDSHMEVISTETTLSESVIFSNKFPKSSGSSFFDSLMW